MWERATGPRGSRGRRGGVLTLLLATLALLLAVLPPPALPAQERADSLRIHFLDVGQGAAALVEGPGGQRVLLDAGPRGGGVVDHLRSLEVDTIALLVASHNHADHIGGAAAVARAFPIRFYMDNGVPHTTVTYRRTLEALRDRDVALLEPERRTVELGGAVLEILSPPGDPALGHNDNSVGILVRFGAFQALFPGDAEPPLWAHWLETVPELLAPVEVHHASHHGSRNGDVAEAVERLRPELVVVSAGRNNPYGHPHPEALALYRSVGAEVLTTAAHGTVTVAAAPDGGFGVRVREDATAVERAPPVPDRCVELNRASEEELQEIIHLGPERAEEVVSLREVRPFHSVEGLVRVDGIAAGRLSDILQQARACVR